MLCTPQLNPSKSFRVLDPNQEGGNDNRDGARKVLARLIGEQVAKECSCKGSGGLKEPLFLLENILAMIHAVGGGVTPWEGPLPSSPPLIHPLQALHSSNPHPLPFLPPPPLPSRPTPPLR
ncbi:hypothetical protein HPB47_017375 [Ixodes persulcatus]|uniref:Uncharacterized protein n=1 Tax=Ixodes persulcatus TaxID=34615 RepID=A0AC60QNE8_IXOPE|nr:hypothetical protein HPB47_017375 [Ixodes persulcatus]